MFLQVLHRRQLKSFTNLFKCAIFDWVLHKPLVHIFTIVECWFCIQKNVQNHLNIPDNMALEICFIPTNDVFEQQFHSKRDVCLLDWPCIRLPWLEWKSSGTVEQCVTVGLEIVYILEAQLWAKKIKEPKKREVKNTWRLCFLPQNTCFFIQKVAE